MAGYKLLTKPAVAKELGAIPRKDRERLIRRITELASNPRREGCQKLSGEEDYRIRQRNYRVIYSIDEINEAARILKIAHRKDVYHQLG